MSSAIQHRIARIEPLPGFRIRIWWQAGGEGITDFSDDLARFPIWEPVRDEAQFNTVRLEEGGRQIEWPEPVDQWGYPVLEVDADGLWHMAQEQAAAAKAAAE